MNSMRVCVDNENRNVFGLQASYSRFNQGRIVDEIIMVDHGLVKADGFVTCQTNDFKENEYIAKLGLIFTTTDLISFVY